MVSVLVYLKTSDPFIYSSVCLGVVQNINSLYTVSNLSHAVLRSILRVKFILVLIIELYQTDDEYTKTCKKQETMDYGW